MTREKHKRPKPRGESTKAEHWGGPTRTSDEGPVMGLEQRGRVRRLHERNNWQQEDLDACDKRLPDGSRVRRESHARFCERPMVQFHRPTQPISWAPWREPDCF